ncbi:MAG TPA: lysylphosphatidylglycerol synthase domain-containing protein [Novosphingobium sp.]|nr:lysylphosphatidylglycerol synthase domain-containing protein [Novosphingobium sp.]
MTAPSSVPAPQGWLKRHQRVLLRAAALVFFLASLAYVGLFAQRNWAAVRTLPPLDGSAAALAAALYLLAHPFTASAWILGLRGLGHDLPYQTGLRISLAAQIGKYLPGNVAHYFARAGMAAGAGIALSGSGLATVLEIVSALLAAALVAAAAMLLDPAPAAVLHQAFAAQPALPLLLAAGATIGTAVIVRLTALPLRVLAVMTLCMTANFLLVGLSFHAVVAALAGPAPSVAAMLGVYTVAWTVGYLVPGAPAGLGVREAVLVAWLSAIIGVGPALACTVLHRLITAAVDTAVGLAGYAWHRAARSDQPAAAGFSKK